MQEDIKKQIDDLENEAKLYLNNWSILDKAEKLVKEYGIEDTNSIYQTKSYWSSKFVNTRKKIEKLQN